MSACFSLGQTVATPGALAALTEVGQSPASFFAATFLAIGATWTLRTSNPTKTPFFTASGC